MGFYDPWHFFWLPSIPNPLVTVFLPLTLGMNLDLVSAVPKDAEQQKASIIIAIQIPSIRQGEHLPGQLQGGSDVSVALMPRLIRR